MGFFKAEGLISGWGKYRKINSFRIIGQGIKYRKLCLKILV
jgi:hypothetical protein